MVLCDCGVMVFVVICFYWLLYKWEIIILVWENCYVLFIVGFVGFDFGFGYECYFGWWVDVVGELY